MHGRGVGGGGGGKAWQSGVSGKEGRVWGGDRGEIDQCGLWSGVVTEWCVVESGGE